MKILSGILYCGLAMLVASIAGCTHGFEAINTDPNKMQVGDLQPYGMFEPLLYGMANQQTYYAYYWTDELAQFTVSSLTAQERHRYKITDIQWGSLWNNYAGKGLNATHMYELGVKFGDKGCQAVALTLKVYALSNLTDLFGDIPYSEAYRQREGIDRPRFDTQKEVYEQMFAELETANELYAQQPTFERASLDIMYGGDMKLWRKFNNSLYLRLLCRVSGRPEMKAGEKIAAMLKDSSKYPLIASNTENATIHNTGVDPYFGRFRPADMTKMNFTSSAYKIAKQFIAMTTIADGADSEQDPRLTTWAERDGDDWKGATAGCELADQQVDVKDCALLNYKVLVRDDAPNFLMDYSEIRFIMAEAALKGWIDGGEAQARVYYESAVKASCQKWAELERYSDVKAPIDDNAIAKLLAGRLAGWDSHTDKERLIAEQKYLSLFWVGLEAYHELRRTSWPELTIGRGALYNDWHLPQRMGYPSESVGSNPDNVNAALSNMGGVNNMLTPVWWSYKAINGTFREVRPDNAIN